MTEQLDMMDLVEPGQSSVSIVQMPTGFLDDAGELHTEAHLKELTGSEEDILASKRMTVSQKISKIICNCVTQIGPYKQDDEKWAEKIGSLVTTDRLFLLIRIRMISLGDSLSFRFECPQEDCKKVSTQTVCLQDFKISGLADPKLRKWSGVLPRTKKTFELKAQTGSDDDKASSMKGEDTFSQIFMVRLISLDGKKPTIKDIKELPLIDRQFLRNQLKRNEGEIDSSVEIECPHCKFETKHDMDIGTPDFFFPSEM
jgi:hypothetical protein